MVISTRSPAAGDGGARKCDLFGSRVDSEFSNYLIDFQVNFVARRLRVPPALATTIAMHAFETRRRA
jgi:hypothetical protein